RTLDAHRRAPARRHARRPRRGRARHHARAGASRLRAGGRAMSEAPATVRAMPMTILVVSSDEGTLRAFDTTLGALGDRCVAVMDLAEAIAAASTAASWVQPLAAAFVEVAMGEGGGLALVQHLPAVHPGVP